MHSYCPHRLWMWRAEPREYRFSINLEGDVYQPRALARQHSGEPCGAGSQLQPGTSRREHHLNGIPGQDVEVHRL